MRYVYVTGADRGLGLALSRILIRNGFTVFAGSYMPEWHELGELKAESGDCLRIVPLDVTSDRSVAEAAETIRRETDRLEIVVNNAAIFLDRSGTIFGELYFDDMRRIMDTNAFGPLRVTHSVIDLLLGGSRKQLVNISSEAASIANSARTHEFGYTMSKSALNMQSKLLHNELSPRGVQVFAFHPGYVRSYMLGRLNTDATVEPTDSAAGIWSVLESRLGRPDTPIYLDYKGNPMPW
ncbi:SDR family NAD(P)-dependent oxidoreductase [Paenibacillus humicola]|uniref:SDR family NAD(P)-dependent oxidoreductase n=1 Tax=Paenibacillus humicola TaxID=3110540 RepID=UPI00237AC12F|nr:SDR family NAD(P)-dependent oxidoreductase [Paenibacillus humicola]